MYPAEALNRLAVRKAALVQAMVVDRAQCVAAARRVARPLDGVRNFWRRLAPGVRYAVVPLAALTLRAVLRRRKSRRRLVRWLPLALGAARVLGAVLQRHRRSRT